MIKKLFIDIVYGASYLLITLCITLTGCSSETSWLKELFENENIQDIGAVHVAVLSVAPFQKYRDAVQPQFKLTPDDAIMQVLPSTLSTEQRIVDSWNFKLKAAAKMTSFGIEPTTDQNQNTAEEKSKDSSKENSTGTSKDESASQTKTADRSAANLPVGATASAATLGQNPLLKYWTAVALYQEVQLLNRYVEDAAIRGLYNAFVVRLQITLLPWKRSQPYDAYADISFFDRKPENDIRVLPLLVTDDVESALVARSNDRVRQLALGLAAGIHNINLSSDIERLYEQLESISGRDYNSAFTVARVSENTLRARFGAMNQGKKRYSMIPQTHNVTFLLMIKKVGGGPDVDLVCRPTFVNPITGKGAKDKSEKIIKENIDNITKKHGIILENNQRMKLLQFIENNEANEFKSYFENIMKNKERATKISTGTSEDESASQTKTDENQTTVGKLNDWKFLWVDLAQERDASRYQTASFELPKIPDRNLPDEKQTIMLMDDAKTCISATLVGFKGLNARKLQVNLSIPLRSVDMDGKVLPNCDSPDQWPKCEKIFAADSIKSGPTDDQFTVTFPSLAAINRSPVNDAVKITVVSLEDTTLTKTYKANYAVKKGDRPFEIVIRERVINSNEKGEGRLVVNVTKAPKNGVTLNLNGAAFDINNVTADPADSLSSDEKKKGVLKLSKAPAIVNIQLFNLSSESYVTVYAADETGESTAPITLRVASLSGSGKKEKE